MQTALKSEKLAEADAGGAGDLPFTFKLVKKFNRIVQEIPFFIKVRLWPDMILLVDSFHFSFAWP